MSLKYSMFRKQPSLLKGTPLYWLIEVTVSQVHILCDNTSAERKTTVYPIWNYTEQNSGYYPILKYISSIPAIDVLFENFCTIYFQTSN